MKKYFTIFLILILFTNTKGYEQRKVYTPEFSIIGTWKVIKAEPDLSYLRNKMYLLSAKQYDSISAIVRLEELGKKITFKCDSILSSLFGEKNTIYKGVKYIYRSENAKRYFKNAGYTDENRPKYTHLTIEKVNISFLNLGLKASDTLKVIYERINNDLLHINFDAKSMFLKREN